MPRCPACAKGFARGTLAHTFSRDDAGLDPTGPCDTFEDVLSELPEMLREAEMLHSMLYDSRMLFVYDKAGELAEWLRRLEATRCAGDT